MAATIYGTYITQRELKTYVSDTKNAALLVRDDKLIARFCVMASRWLENQCNRVFLPQRYTNKYDYQSGTADDLRSVGRTLYPSRLVRRTEDRSLELRLFDDLLTLISAKTNNGGTTIANSDILFRRGPSRNVLPYDTLELKSDTTAQWLYTGTKQEAHRIDAYWGFHSQWPDAAWETVGNHDGTATPTTTALTVKGQPETEVGQLFGPAFQEQLLIKFGTTLDGTEELAYITQITDNADTTFTIQVIRGVNGTTAISLTDNMPIQAYRPMSNLKEVMFELGAYFYRRRHSVGQRDDRTVLSRSGMVMLPNTLPETVNLFIDRYRRRNVASRN